MKEINRINDRIDLAMEPEREFLLWETRSRDTIDVKRCYFDATGDWTTAILLSQIIYWFLPQKKTEASKTSIERDGRRWIAKKHEDWWEEIRVSPATAKRHLARLAELDLVVTKVWKFDGNPTTHISPNFSKLSDVLHFPSAQPEPNQPSQSELPVQLNLSRTYKEAETTAKSTSEIEPVGLFENLPIKNEPISVEKIIKDTWIYYLKTIGKSALTTLTPKRMKMAFFRYQEVLKVVPNPVPDLVAALMRECIDELAASDWHMGRDPQTHGKKYNEWENIFRSAEQFQKWADKAMA